MKKEIFNNVCSICRKPLNHWFHAQGMRCGNPECEEKYIEILNRIKDK